MECDGKQSRFAPCKTLPCVQLYLLQKGAIMNELKEMLQAVPNARLSQSAPGSALATLHKLSVTQRILKMLSSATARINPVLLHLCCTAKCINLHIRDTQCQPSSTPPPLQWCLVSAVMPGISFSLPPALTSSCSAEHFLGQSAAISMLLAG